jgi:eukaryotic-like serine/threonine-protein kinase
VERLVSRLCAGEARLAAYQGKEARSNFRKSSSIEESFTTNPSVRSRVSCLARAWALEGDTGKARAAYRDFLTAWKDADPDIPILK